MKGYDDDDDDEIQGILFTIQYRIPYPPEFYRKQIT
jgi:hypothetical protein